MLTYFFYWPAERTEKIPMGSIKNVVTEPIEGHEDYNMMVCVCRNISNKLCTFSSNRLFYLNCFFCAAVRQKHFLSNNEYIYLYKYACLFVTLGVSAGSDRSLTILGLLGACTVCWCNQRHSPRKMAVFLTCLYRHWRIGIQIKRWKTLTGANNVIWRSDFSEVYPEQTEGLLLD